MNIEDVEGIGPRYAATLRTAGVTTTDGLLERGATRKGRAELAGTLGISEKLILEWVNHADLMRLKGVGPEYADLLEACGVDSPAELAQRNGANLARAIGEANEKKKLVRQLPSEATLAGWIAAAKDLKKVVEH